MWFEAEYSLPLIDCGGKFLSKSALEEKLKDETQPFLLALRADALTQDAVSFLSELPLLKALCVTYCRPEPALLESLKGLASVDELWLQFGSATNEFMESISEFSNITRLELAQTEILDKGMKALGKLSRLEELNLMRTRITDKGLKNIASLVNLTWLNLQECAKITDSGLDSLADLQNITYLNLSGVKKITDDFAQRVIPYEAPEQTGASKMS